MSTKQKLVSGITATGSLTIGNYIGAIKNLIGLGPWFLVLGIFWVIGMSLFIWCALIICANQMTHDSHYTI